MQKGIKVVPLYCIAVGFLLWLLQAIYFWIIKQTMSDLSVLYHIVDFVIGAAGFGLIGIFVCRKLSFKTVMISSIILTVYGATFGLLFVGMGGILSIPTRMFGAVAYPLSFLLRLIPNNIAQALALIFIQIALPMSFCLFKIKTRKDKEEEIAVKARAEAAEAAALSK